MKEIEVKIIEINFAKTIALLERLGAKKILDATIKSCFFDFPGEKLKKNGIVLRIREYPEKTVLVLKRKIKKARAKIMDETETRISSADEIKKILFGLGMEQTYLDKRKRVSYSLGKFRFDFDSYPGIPAFMEIEAPSEKKLFEIIKKLGFPKEKIKAWNTNDLFRHYGKKRRN